MSSVDLSPVQIDRFRTIVSGRLGLRFEDGQTGFLAEALRRRLESTGRLPEVYLSQLQSSGGPQTRDEFRAIAQDLTVTETYFLRNRDQFRAFREVVLPDRVRARSRERRLRMLSAGCASGEEAYSIGISIRDFPDTLGWQVAIHGIDVNLGMLDKAARGRYSPWALRETPAEVQGRWFHPDGRDFALDEGIRSMVTFSEQNLVDPDPAFWQPQLFDVIFCRNVLMYFTPEIAQAVVGRIWRSLAPDGFLFLGHAETLRGLSQDFHLRHTHGTFYYQRRDAADRSERSATMPGWGLASIAGDVAVPATIALDDSWVETIRRASERVHTLTAAHVSPPEVAAPGAATTATRGLGRPGRTWDLGSAVELIRQEKFSEADALLTTLPSESARDPDVLLMRAVLLTHGGDLAAAERICDQVLQLDQMSAGAHYLLALCREDAGDRSGAVDHNQVAAYLDPAFAMPRLHLGLLARRAGDRARARRELAEALVLLQREDASRLLLFAGGFGREALVALCRAELVSCGGAP